MADEPTPVPPAPEPEPVTPPEPAQEAPAPAETPSPAPTEQPATETPTAQIPASEPLAPEVEPLPPEPTPEPPPQAASVPVASTPPRPAQTGRDLLVKARATIQDRKHKKLERILEVLTTKGKITNDEVEKLLHVSDATATRYLSALEKEGKIQQVGKTGKAVEYTRI